MQVSVDAHRHTSLQSLLALADEAAALGPDMRVPELEPRTIDNKTQPQSSMPELSGLDRDVQKDAAFLGREKLIQKYGQPRADRAIESRKGQVLTAQQATMKYRLAKRLLDQEYGKDLRAAGVKPMQHSLKDFVRVIYTQLELQLNGDNLSANEVLNLAFPDDPMKAKRIGESKRMQRVQEAYDSPAIQNHQVEKAMLEHHGQRRMNLRTQTQKFSQSLSAGIVLFEGYDVVTKLKAQVAEQGARISTLERKVESTKNREALADAGATDPKEMVLVLTHEGKGPAEIARLLDMPRETVRTIRRRSK